MNEPLQKRVIQAVALVPTIGLAVCTLVVAVFCRQFLAEATEQDVELASLGSLLFAILGFILASGAVVVFQALRFSQRIAGPAYRLIKSLERIRAGDLSFRVNLRRGDHLTDVAAEMNRLLDWLNANPPRGAKTGSDLVRLRRRAHEARDGDRRGAQVRVAVLPAGRVEP